MTINNESQKAGMTYQNAKRKKNLSNQNSICKKQTKTDKIETYPNKQKLW